jgi:hypothetical protein
MRDSQGSGRYLHALAVFWSTNRQNDFFSGCRFRRWIFGLPEASANGLSYKRIFLMRLGEQQQASGSEALSRLPQAA